MPAQKGFSIIFLITAMALLTAGIIGGVYYINEHTQLLNASFEKATSTPKTKTTQSPESLSRAAPSSKPITSPAIPTSTIGNPTPSNWKELNLNSCMITIKYPATWEIDKYEESQSCAIQIKDLSTKTSFSLLTTSTGRERLNLSTIPSSATAEQIENSEGTVYIYSDKNPKRYSFAKGNVLFSGILRNPSSDAEAEKAFRTILSSTKFTGDENFYIQPSNINFEDHPSVLKLLSP